MKILIINGPNLNLLGEREPGIYGEQGYDALEAAVKAKAELMGAECEMYQSNSEGAIIDRLHAARREFDGVVINAGAYTHYSYAIRDAIAAIKIPCIEVHISNVFARDEFRSHSVISAVCAGAIFGLGFNGYLLAMDALVPLTGAKL